MQDTQFDAVCETVVAGILREWSPQTVRSVETTAAELLRREFTAGEDVRRWAGALGLLEHGSEWLVETGSVQPLPNPVLMVAGRLGGDVPDAPLSRDPVTLMLSVVAQVADGLRIEEQEALIGFVLQPWHAEPARLMPYLTSAVGAIHRAGHESLKTLRQGDWRSQFLLESRSAGRLPVRRSMACIL